jgi:hypothetical protein
MVKAGHVIFVILILLVSLFRIFPAEKSVVLKPVNNSFESSDRRGFPLHWQVKAPGLETAAVRLELDGKDAHSGQYSLSLAHKHMQQSELVSEPLELKVGHLYRLSGWIKTRSAVTRPLDRYPTPVAACLSMESLPFTNPSPSVGGTSPWTRVETLFIATRSKDRVRLHLGYNGDAKGDAWFDDITLEKVEDIGAYIPLETVKWFGPAFRYKDRGWIYVHIEGKPYQRGYQYGYLVAEEIVSYMEKLAYQANNNEPDRGWLQLRRITDAFLLKKYDEEYLTEMKGIADGAAYAGAMYDNRKLDLVDIVTLNSVVDLGQLWRALRHNPHALSGKSFLAAEDELLIPLREHKCSGFLANGPATPNGEIVFGQIFMWGGYTGVHWNVICDVVPEKGYRLVYETFPGGIHSGADFYVNSAGIMIGETTVSQTPYDMDGTPQSNRIRKAAQYANSIDEVVKILEHKNNGMYTNDWLIGDAKTNETAIFLLGTRKSKLWRSSSGEFPGGTKGFFWSNNNNKDNEVRKEYIPNADNAPYDLVFSPWNRDLAFNRFFKEYNGQIDAIAGVNLWATSPINRAHACDGKIITTEMARELVFLAHFGKVTLRSKFPLKNQRILRDDPLSEPHLSLGYSIVSPKFVSEKLKALKKQSHRTAGSGVDDSETKHDLSKVEAVYSFSPRDLWFNTVYPASEKENWFVSGTAAYWRMLKELPEGTPKAAEYLTEQLNSLNAQLSYNMSREEPIAPLQVQRVYDRYSHYRIPRIRGTYLLHQLRLYLGNKTFSRFMNTLHNRFKDKPMSNRQFMSLLKKVSGKSLEQVVMQWLERKTLPEVSLQAAVEKTGQGWALKLDVNQSGHPFRFITTLRIDTAKENRWETVEVDKGRQGFIFNLTAKPLRVIFNVGNDIPVSYPDFYTFSNYFEDFHHTRFVYGTGRQVEANRELADRFRTMLANRYTEIIPPLRKDSEIDEAEKKENDLFVLGGPEDNRLMKRLVVKLGLTVGKNFFQWQGRTYGSPDDGLFVAYPNPYNPGRIVYLVIANSALQLYNMTDQYHQLPSWAVFKGNKTVKMGYHSVRAFSLDLKD